MLLLPAHAVSLQAVDKNLAYETRDLRDSGRVVAQYRIKIMGGLCALCDTILQSCHIRAHWTLCVWTGSGRYRRSSCFIQDQIAWKHLTHYPLTARTLTQTGVVHEVVDSSGLSAGVVTEVVYSSGLSAGVVTEVLVYLSSALHNVTGIWTEWSNRRDRRCASDRKPH